jgi:C-terminal processing protease CtpA/Prc
VLSRGAANQARLWLRVDRPDRAVGFLDAMTDRPVARATWAAYEISGHVAEDAEHIVFGAIATGVGTFAFDDFELAASRGDGGWEPIAIENPGFEKPAGSSTLASDSTNASQYPIPGWTVSADAYDVTTQADVTAQGAHAASLRKRMHTRSEPLFDAEPAPGEAIDRPLGAGLMLRLPVSLYSDADGTLPRADTTGFRQLQARLDEVDPTASADLPLVRIAAVLILWNVMQHFYPYFDVVPVDWEAELDRALAAALADRTSEEFYETLRGVVARLDDGHGLIIHPAHRLLGRLPINLEWVEGRIVVTASADTALRSGDVIVSLDGRSALDVLEAEERLTSGSPQWKRYRALTVITGGAQPGTSVQVGIERDRDRFDIIATRATPRIIADFDRPEISELEPGIWYVALDRASWPAIESMLDTLAAARGVVFDLRGYPAGNHSVLQHLLTRADTSAAWMRTPWVLYPDQERSAGARRGGWALQPLQPHIGGRIAFVTDGRAISYAESVMGFVEHYRLGEIVGAPTAGANGNVNPLPLPGGFGVSWTGMRVVKHDGTQHHLIGIQPTIPTTRTIAGIKAGRDELLEAALRSVRPSRH